MSTQVGRHISGRHELEGDQRTERLIFWKGVFSVLVVVLIVLVRSWWWV